MAGLGRLQHTLLRSRAELRRAAAWPLRAPSRHWHGSQHSTQGARIGLSWACTNRLGVTGRSGQLERPGRLPDHVPQVGRTAAFRNNRHHQECVALSRHLIDMNPAEKELWYPPLSFLHKKKLTIGRALQPKIEFRVGSAGELAHFG